MIRFALDAQFPPRHTSNVRQKYEELPKMAW